MAPILAKKKEANAVWYLANFNGKYDCRYDRRNGQFGDRVSKGGLVCTYGPIRETLITNGVDNYKLRKLDRLDQWKNAVCYDPAQFALGGIREAHVRAGDAVAIFGLGAIGQIAIQLAKKQGATTIVGIDPIAQRKRISRKIRCRLHARSYESRCRFSSKGIDR